MLGPDGDSRSILDVMDDDRTAVATVLPCHASTGASAGLVCLQPRHELHLPAPVPLTAATARLVAFLGRAGDLVAQGQQAAANPPDPDTLAQLAHQVAAM